VPSFRALFLGRGWRDTLAWLVCLLIAAGALARAAQTGRGWGLAIAVAVMAVAYTFVPWLQPLRDRREAARLARLNGTLTIDDWGVTRVAGELREAVAWKDLEWVAIQTTDDGPWREDFFFLLGGQGGKGCAVSNWLATRTGLLAALQERLPGLDNAQVAVAAGSTENATFTIWRRPEPGGSSPPPQRPN
jgi:hypothetical protein